MAHRCLLGRPVWLDPTRSLCSIERENAISVQYYGRVNGLLTSSSRRGEQHFELDEDQPTDGIPMVMNRTELRSIVLAADLVEVPDGIWGLPTLPRTAEQEALSWCRSSAAAANALIETHATSPVLFRGD